MLIKSNLKCFFLKFLVKIQDPETGKTFYANVNTGESSPALRRKRRSNYSSKCRQKNMFKKTF